MTDQPRDELAARVRQVEELNLRSDTPSIYAYVALIRDLEADRQRLREASGRALAEQSKTYREIVSGVEAENARLTESLNAMTMQYDEERDIATTYENESIRLRAELVTLREALARMVGSAQHFIDFNKQHSGPFAVPHDAACADLQHDHTGSRYDAKGAYLGGWKSDHECPPCDCGAQALIEVLAVVSTVHQDVQRAALDATTPLSQSER